MEYSTIDTEDSQAVGPRKPRVALMGEFSAGKSTLTNMLLGESPVPTRVTATRLPPVWISYGEPCAVCVGLDGSETEIDIADIDQRHHAARPVIQLHPLGVVVDAAIHRAEARHEAALQYVETEAATRIETGSGGAVVDHTVDLAEGSGG